MSTIIYIGGFELPEGNAAAQRVLNNARVFRALGYRVILVGVSRARSYDHQLHPANAGGADVEAWEVGYPAGSRQWFDNIRADWPVRQLAETGKVDPADVAAVVCYNHPAIAQRNIARLARQWGAKALTDCTEWYAPRSWTSPGNIIKNLDVPMRMHWVNRRMDAIITTSPYMTGFYRATGLPIVEIPTLMDRPAAELPPLEPGVPVPLFALASGFGEDALIEHIHDRIDWVIDLLGGAAERGAPFVLRVVGAERDPYLRLFPQHRALLDRLGDSVQFLGRQPRAKVLDLLQGSAFAFVLRKENRVTLAGFPTKYSEAVTYGTPVIINALPSVRAYHVEGKTGFTLDPDDRDGAVRRLCDILAMDAEAVMAMKQYCRDSGAFAVEAFEPQVAAFMAAVAGKERACPSIA